MIHVKHFRLGEGTGRLVLCLLLAFFAAAAPGIAQTFPTLSGRVVDAAGLLDEARRNGLEGRLAAFEAKAGDQVVVATVPDLQGYAIEEFSVGLARAWGIGRKGENNGVLLLVSKGDRKVRIEVGYGLEGTLTDALTKVIIEEDILPAFRSGDYPKGIETGVDGIIAVLSGNDAELKARAARRDGATEDAPSATVVAIFVALFALFWVFAILGAVFCRLARAYGTRVGRNRWRWLGIAWCRDPSASVGRSGWIGGFSSSSGSSGGGGFSGGGGSFGGGGSSGSW